MGLGENTLDTLRGSFACVSRPCSGVGCRGCAGGAAVGSSEVGVVRGAGAGCVARRMRGTAVISIGVDCRVHAVGQLAGMRAVCALGVVVAGSDVAVVVGRHFDIFVRLMRCYGSNV